MFWNIPCWFWTSDGVTCFIWPRLAPLVHIPQDNPGKASPLITTRACRPAFWQTAARSTLLLRSRWVPSTTKTFSNTTIFALAAFCLPFRLGEAEHCVCGISSHGLEEGGGVAPCEKVSSRARPPLPTTSSSTLHPPALERDGNSRRHLSLSLFNHPPIPLLSQPVSFLRCLKIALFLIIGSEGGSTIFLTYFVLFGFGQTHMHSCSLGLVCSFPTSNLFVNSVRIGGAAAAASLLSGDCCQNNFLLPNHISWSSPLAFSNLQFSGLFCGHSLWLISKKAPRSNQRKPKLIALCWSNKKTRYNWLL